MFILLGFNGFKSYLFMNIFEFVLLFVILWEFMLLVLILWEFMLLVLILACIWCVCFIGLYEINVLFCEGDTKIAGKG